MKVLQAFYGATPGGHGVLHASAELGSAAREIAWRMDLPATAPPGVDWKPYVSGFPLADLYVLAKTQPDSAATRGGLVVSHALFFPIEAVAAVDNLGPLFARLNADTPSVGAEAFELDLSSAPPSSPPFAATLAGAYLGGKEPPVVVLGEEHLEAAAVFLWSRLWPAARQTFSFRLSFSPQDIEDIRLDLIATPAIQKLRWPHVVDVADLSAPTPAAAAVFAGLADGEEVAALGRALGHQPAALADFERLASAWRHVNDAAGGVDPLLAAARLYAVLSPNPLLGETPKKALIERLAAAALDMKGPDLLKIATLDLSAFPKAERLLTAIERRMTSLVQAPSPEEAVLLATAANPKAQPGWTQAIWQGLEAAARTQSKSLATALWTWWSARTELIELSLPHLGALPGLELALIGTLADRLSSGMGQLVESSSAARGWWRLHGAAAAAWRGPLEAMQVQLKMDPGQGLEGLRLAAVRATGADRLAAALESAAPSAITLAGEAAAASPRLLQAFEASSPTWRGIWRMALAHNPKAWSGPKNPAEALAELLNAAIVVGDRDDALLDLLATTPLANLLALDQRGRVWPALPSTSRPLFLAATANAWLEQVQSDPANVASPEPELALAITVSAQLAAFERAAPLDAVITAYTRVSELTEDRFLRWLTGQIIAPQGMCLTELQATQLGELVHSRSWARAAAALLDANTRQGRHDLRPAVRIAADLYDLTTRYLNGLFFGPAGVDAKWAILAHIAAELYPEGPGYERLWSRAGGHDADLPDGWTGRDRWERTLNLMRNGRGTVASADLLQTMAKDFPGNSTLVQLQREPEFAPRPKGGRK